MQRYADDVGKQAQRTPNYLAVMDLERSDVQKACPVGWKASGHDMCCEQWWPDARAQRCKTLSSGKVWDRDWGHGWRAKKLGE